MSYTNLLFIKNFGLTEIRDFSDLAFKLSISSSRLYSLVYKKDKFYKKALIPKKNGENRVLCIPTFSMKTVQAWIYEHILKKIDVSEYSMAFVPGKNGLLESAKKHSKSVFLLEMDIHDFFGSIEKYKVQLLFMKVGYASSVASLLAELCTYEDVLPQGAVTSPYLANLLSHSLDARIEGICKRRSILYSRYADDLCFSSDDIIKLKKIKPIITSIVEDEGFTVNENKTRFLSNSRKKSVVGITINNGEIHANGNLKKAIRAKINSAITSGDYQEKDRIIGMIAFVTSIEKGYKDKIIKYIKSIIDKDFVCSNKNLVNAFNHNKFYKELPNCKYVRK